MADQTTQNSSKAKPKPSGSTATKQTARDLRLPSDRPLGELSIPSAGEFLDKDIKEPRVLLGPFLREGYSCMVWAQTGVGKTWFALSVALAVSGGGSFLGFEATAPAKVLYVDGEMGEFSLQDRLSNLTHAIDDLDVEAMRRNLMLCPRMSQKPLTEFPSLEQTRWQESLVQRAVEDGIECVILDNLTTLCALEDENSATAVQPVNELVKMLKQAGIAVILVHHSGKTGETYRGSSALAAIYEVIIGMTAPEDAVAVDHTSFNVSFTKYRDFRTEAVKDRTCFLLNYMDEGLRWDSKLGTKDLHRELVRVVQEENVTTNKEAFESLDQKYLPLDWCNKTQGAKDVYISRVFKSIADAGLMSPQDRKTCYSANSFDGTEDDF